MSTKKVDELPKCNFCPKDAIYDAPGPGMHWAYMCEACAIKHSTPGNLKIGTKFEKRKPCTAKKTNGILMGIENTDFEAVLMDLENRQIGCPTCGENTSFEVDASGTFNCGGCGQKLRIPEL